MGLFLSIKGYTSCRDLEEVMSVMHDVNNRIPCWVVVAPGDYDRAWSKVLYLESSGFRITNSSNGYAA